MKKVFFFMLFVGAALAGTAQGHVVRTMNGDTLSGVTTKIPLPAGDEGEMIDPDVNNNLDSLLSVWYLQRALRDTTGADMEESYIIADLPDSIYIDRLKRLPALIDLPYNEVVRRSIVYYTQRMPEKAEMILGLAQYYLPMVEEILDSYNMPLELRAMAVIESALNPRAVSRAGAKGMWQFMYRTALAYDLKINSYVDERLDPIVATHAAARHLKDLYGIFGDWSLAIAAYNCGAGNVNKAIRRAGGKRDYWEIYPYLPRETRGYVPNFVAASYLLEYHKEHRLTPKSIEMPAQTDTFLVNQMLHFGQISDVVGISIDELRDFNPQFLHDIIPGTYHTYSLCIPHEYTGTFAEKEKEIYTYQDSVYFNQNIIKQIASAKSTPAGSGGTRIHRVRRGETLSSIALKYGVKISDIQYWNNIGSSTRILGGQKLIVKGSAARTAMASKSAVKTSGNGIHVVKKGENLWRIAQAYDDITVYDLMQLNNLTKNSTLMPGDKLKVRKK